MPLWAKYDRANGRIVAITDTDNPPPEDKLVGVIEVDASLKVGDFIGDDDTPPRGDPASNPNAPIGKPPPSPPGHGGDPPPGHGGTPPGQANKPQPKNE